MLAGLAWIFLQAPNALPAEHPPPSAPEARVLVVERGASARSTWTAPSEGTLHAWVSSTDLDPSVRVESPAGERLAEDDDGGGGTNAFVAIPCRAGTALVIFARAEAVDAGGTVELVLAFSPETEATRAAVTAAREASLVVEELRSAGERAEAQRRVAAALEALLATPGAGESVEVLRQARALGYVAYQIGLLDIAHEAWTFVADRSARYFPDEHRDLQVLRLNLAVARKQRGDLPGARMIEERLLSVALRVLPPEDDFVLAVKQNLAATVKDQGELDHARRLEEEVVAALERTAPPGDADLQQMRCNLAVTLLRQGHLVEARLRMEQAVAALERTLPDDSPVLDVARTTLGAVLRDLGEVATARALFEHVHEHYSRALPEGHPSLLVVRMNLGVTLAQMGELDRAVRILQSTLEARERSFPDDHPDVQANRMNLASALRDFGDRPRAHELFRKILDVYEARQVLDAPELLEARLNYAASLLDLGELAGARDLLYSVLKSGAQVWAPEHPNLQLAQQNLTAALYMLGEHAEARKVVEALLEARQALFSEDAPPVQVARMLLASVLKAQDELEAAAESEEIALDRLAAALPPDAVEVRSARSNLAATLRVLASQPAATPERRARAAELRREIGRSLVRVARDAVRSRARREAEERAAQLASELSHALELALAQDAPERAGDPELVRDVFLAAELRRGAVLGWSRRARGAELTERVAAIQARARAAATQLAHLARSGASDDALRRVRSEQESAEAELAELARAAAATAAPADDAGVAEIAARLGQGRALVAYLRGASTGAFGERTGDEDARLRAFVLRSDGRLACVQLGALGPIETAVRAWRDAVGAQVDRGTRVGAPQRGEIARSGRALRELVLDPLLPHLDGAQHLVVVLDDVLNLVPLDALSLDGLAEAQGSASHAPAAGSRTELVGDRWQVEVRSSAVELLWDEPARTGPQRLLALGDADFDRAPAAIAAAEPTNARQGEEAGLLRGGAWERAFPTLTQTGEEVRAIARYFQDSFGAAAEVLLIERRDATVERLVATASSARWIHVATHGWFAPESVPAWGDEESAAKGRRTSLGPRATVTGMNPMLLCGLALSGANLPADDTGRVAGLVTAEELAALDLAGCELAVLSACDTNVGVRRAGLGVASLQRALRIAGARSVITALWHVPDRATRELMQDFYRRLWIQGKPAARALWEAKLRLRDAVDEFGNPRHAMYDWAAWILTGSQD